MPQPDSAAGYDKVKHFKGEARGKRRIHAKPNVDGIEVGGLRDGDRATVIDTSRHR